MRIKLITALLVFHNLSPMVVAADHDGVDRESLIIKARQYVVECSDRVRQGQINDSSLFRVIMLKLRDKHPKECVNVGREWLKRSFYEGAGWDVNGGDQDYRHNLATSFAALDRFATDLGEDDISRASSLEYHSGVVSGDGTTGPSRAVIPTLTGHTTLVGK
jgi:hypothetical protein